MRAAKKIISISICPGVGALNDRFSELGGPSRRFWVGLETQKPDQAQTGATGLAWKKRRIIILSSRAPAPNPHGRGAKIGTYRFRKRLVAEGSHFASHKLASGFHKKSNILEDHHERVFLSLSTPQQTHSRESRCRRSLHPRSSASRPGRFPRLRTRPRSGTTTTTMLSPSR